MKSITIEVNGDTHNIEVDENMPLLWVLRDTLGKAGTKFGCGKGLCGACTVHVDKEAVRSCITPITSVVGKSITTIEGLAQDGEFSKLQQVWCELDVAQCGYCQGGQIMSATALLNKSAKPSEEEIDSAMSGNICRCATYSRIKKAIITATK